MIRRRTMVATLSAVAVSAVLVTVAPSSTSMAAVIDDVQFAQRISTFIINNIETVWQEDIDDSHPRDQRGVELTPGMRLTGHLAGAEPLASIVPSVEFHTLEPLDDGGRFHLLWTNGIDIFDDFAATEPGAAGLAADGLWRIDEADSDSTFFALDGLDVPLATIDAAFAGPRTLTLFIYYAPLAPRVLQWAELDGATWIFTPKPASTAAPASTLSPAAASAGLPVTTDGFIPGDAVTATLTGPPPVGAAEIRPAAVPLTLTAGPTGAVALSIPLPIGAVAGAYRITLSSALPYDQTFDFALVADAAATAADPELAATGTPSIGAAATAATALMAGVGLLLLRRRRVRIR